MHSILNGRQAESKFVPYQELEVKQLVYDYLTDPKMWYLSNQRFSNSVMMSVVFGRRAALDDPQLKLIGDLMRLIEEALFSPLKSIPDVFTSLSNLPKSLQWWRPSSERIYHANVA